MNPKIEALINRLQQARYQLNSAAGKVSPETEICPDWKLKQLVDHITGWDELTTHALNEYLQGGSPSLKVKGGVDRYNAASVAARKSMSLEDSFQAYENARQELYRILEQVPADILTQKFPAPWGGKCTVTSVVKIISGHEFEHARQLEELLNKP